MPYTRKYKARIFTFTNLWDFSIDIADNIDIGNQGGYSSPEVAKYYAEKIARQLGIKLEWKREATNE